MIPIIIDFETISILIELDTILILVDAWKLWFSNICMKNSGDARERRRGQN